MQYSVVAKNPCNVGVCLAGPYTYEDAKATVFTMSCLAQHHHVTPCHTRHAACLYTTMPYVKSTTQKSILSMWQKWGKLNAKQGKFWENGGRKVRLVFPST